MNKYFHRRPMKTDEEKRNKMRKKIKDKAKKSFVNDKEKEIQNQKKRLDQGKENKSSIQAEEK